ncbi:RNA-binding protein 34 [Plakobranchus ocellatus]|uniref:RNA-binding protein 34 n=1 Tax=Plakobranchus ocellatus TaxID=259542 RepID=A0AAV4B375_9GAST|nr:RNA-binding protein 34 [Plakobranchus ocellatus]
MKNGEDLARLRKMQSYKSGQVSAQLFDNSNSTKQNKLANLFAVKSALVTSKKKAIKDKPKSTSPPKQAASSSALPFVHETLQKNKPEKRKLSSPAKSPNRRKLENNDKDEFMNKRPRRDRVRDRHNDSRTIFVGNCPLTADRKALKSLFKEFGEIESVRFRCAPPADPNLPRRAIVITKNFHEQCKNYIAYIVFKEEASAKKALMRNGHLLDGLHLRVDIASHSKKHDKKRSVFVGNLPFDITEEDLHAHFADCGEITNVRLVRDRKTSLGKGIGYVQFDSKDSVSLALKLNKTKVRERAIRVMVCTNKPDKLDKNHSKRGKADEETKKKPKKPLFGPSNSTTASFLAKLKTKKEKRLRKMKKKDNTKRSEDSSSSGANLYKPKGKAKLKGAGQKGKKNMRKSTGQKKKKEFNKPKTHNSKGSKNGKRKAK